MIQRILESAEWTSASPGHINTLIGINATETPDFELDIKKLIKEETKNQFKTNDDTEKIKKEKDVDNTIDQVKRLKSGNVGDIEKFTSEQFSNVKSIAQNPFGFFMSTVFKKFAKGAGIAGIALLFIEIVKFIIDQLMQPGRALDTRFKKLIDKQILIFTDRKEQAELRQGFKEVRITTIQGLRGGAGQVGGNFFTPNRIPINYIDSRKLEPSIAAQGVRKFGHGAVGGRGPNSR